MNEEDRRKYFWFCVGHWCSEAVKALPAPHPDTNFFRLAQQIAEEQAGLRERPASLTQWTGSSDAPTTS